MVASLEWVLEESQYKRTIFELTIEELKQLLKIVFETDDNQNIYIVNKSIYDNDIILYVEVDNRIYSYYVAIFNNFDIIIRRDNMELISPQNQAEFIDTIRDMLSMEKPE